jgi:hypothetical protein
MKSRKLTIISFVLLAILLCGAFVWTSESSYEGHSFSEWVEYGYREHADEHKDKNDKSWKECQRAMQAMGAKVIPGSIRLLTAKDSWWKRKWIALFQRQSLFHHEFLSAEQQHYRGYIAFTLLGPESRKALPEIVECLNHADPDVRHYAMMVIVDVIPEKETVVPIFWNLATNKEYASRLEALDTLYAVDRAAAGKAGIYEVKPVLRQWEKNEANTNDPAFQKATALPQIPIPPSATNIQITAGKR